MPRVTNLQNLAAGMPAEDDRLLGAFGRPLSSGLHGAGGILPAPPGYVGEVTLLSATSIQINPFRAMIVGTQSAVQGDYRVVNDAVLTRAIGPSDPTLGRIDLLVTYVRDTAYTPNEGVDDVRYGYVVPGTPAASPAAPATPPNALVHGTITVPSGTGTVTFTPAATAAPGNPVDRGSFTGSLPGASGPQQPGDTAFSVTLNCRLVWTQVSGVYRWRQANVASAGYAGGIAPYLAAVQAAALSWPVTTYYFPHDGFLVWDEPSRRLFAVTGGAVAYSIGGAPGAVYNPGITALTGWSIAFGNVQALGNGLARVYCNITRTGAALTVGVNGDIANVDVANLGAAWGTLGSISLATASSGRVSSWLLAGTTITLTAVDAGVSGGAPVSIATGDVLSFAGMFPLNDPITAY